LSLLESTSKTPHKHFKKIYIRIKHKKRTKKEKEEEEEE
jgi:hypothetical protein